MPTGLQHPSIIDLVTYDPKTEEIAVIMHEYRPWSVDPAHMDELTQKINNYVHFVESGELVAKFPQAAGKSVRLQLDCSQPPLEEIADLIKTAFAPGARHCLCHQHHTFALIFFDRFMHVAETRSRQSDLRLATASAHLRRRAVGRHPEGESA
jgi:hypothetical protein